MNEKYDPNKAFDSFININREIVSIYFIKRKRSKNKHENNWYDSELRDLYKVKQKCYRKYIKQRTVEKLSKYKLVKRQYCIMIEQKKSAFYRSLLLRQKNNTKATWKTINNLLGRGKKSQCQFKISIDNNVEENEIEIANHFNDYFSTVAPSLLSKIDTTKTNIKHFLGCPTTKSFFVVYKVIQSLKN